MQSANFGTPLRVLGAMVISAACAALPRPAGAQANWTGVGAIDGTVMYMDTTTIVRSASLRKVWVRSIDPEPRSLVAGKDTVDFDTVIGLNVFDCAHHTRTVTTVTYMLGEQLLLKVPETHDKPAPLRPKSFFDAVYNDLCGVRR